MTVWIDGELVPASRATVPVLSSAVFRGTSVFDVMAIVSVDGRSHAVGLGEHLARFGRSMELMGMTPRHDLGQLKAAIVEVVERDPSAGVVKTVAMWDHSAGGYLESTVPTIVIAAGPRPPKPPASLHLCTAIAKVDPRVLPPELKVAASYAAGVRAEHDAHHAGFDGIVNVTPDHHLLEGVSSSIGVLSDRTWVLPPLDMVLDSITRRLVADVAADQGLMIDIRPITITELEHANGVALSSTTRPLVPIAQVDDRRFPTDHHALIDMRTSVMAVLAGSHPLSARWLTPLGGTSR